jgi:hypothetical protein
MACTRQKSSTKARATCEAKFGGILNSDREGWKVASGPQRICRTLRSDLFLPWDPAVNSLSIQERVAHHLPWAKIWVTTSPVWWPMCEIPCRGEVSETLNKDVPRGNDRAPWHATSWDGLTGSASFFELSALTVWYPRQHQEPLHGSCAVASARFSKTIVGLLGYKMLVRPNFLRPRCAVVRGVGLGVSVRL